MSGASAFLRRRCTAKFGSIEVCEFEGLKRGQAKILSTRESALANRFNFLFKRVSLVLGTLFSRILRKLQVCNCLSCYCCSQKQGREQTAPCQGKWFMTGGLMRCKPFDEL